MTENFYVGISLGFNSSASIIGTESGVLCAVSQERLNRVKNTKELPFKAIKACLDMAEKQLGYKPKVTEFVYSHYEVISHPYLLKNMPVEYMDKYSNFANKLKMDAETVFAALLKDIFREYIDDDIVLVRREHHESHEHSAYPVYPQDSDVWFTMTADGFGDGYSGRIQKYNEKCEKEVLSQVRVIDSPALIYQFITGSLGFKEHQHEGKVTGLAAHCEANPKKAIALAKKLLEKLTGEKSFKHELKAPWTEEINGQTYHYYDSGFVVNSDLLDPLTNEQKEMLKTSTIVDFERFLRLKNTVYNYITGLLGKDYNKDDILDWLQGNKEIPKTMKYTPWEIAYAAQYFAEQIISSWIAATIPAEDKGKYPVYMAGGLVANVKLNQRVKDSGYFSKIFVSPPMGDEGTAIGCALAQMNSEGFTLKGRMGPEIVINGGTDLNYDNSLDKIIDEAKTLSNLEVIYFDDKDKLIDKVTDLLKDEKIVHWCQQREEFGPRALMNHSTLYTAQDPNGTHTLNQAMGRSEYMPYCPVCKNTSADKLFENWEPGEESCRFMAMTMNCLPGVKEKYRGGVHVDNTARAQFIYENDEWTKDAWKLLDSYEKKTGNLMMINTSFNIHNTPTCNLASDCWDAWKKSNFVGAALVLGNVMFLNK